MTKRRLQHGAETGLATRFGTNIRLCTAIMVSGWSAAACAPQSTLPPAEAPATAAPAATAVPVPEQVHTSGNGHGHAHGHGTPMKPYGIDDWWPDRLDLRVLQANSPQGDPVDLEFDYPTEFKKLDLIAVKKDLQALLTTSQDWWPADYGHYGGLMIRLAWHSSGTYRVTDGRGGSADGAIRFAPLNSWPDNASLDKARRLLWPIKKKYGRGLSWADLMVLAGNVGLESMGFKTLGFGGGRVDVYEPTDINWGPETEWLADQRFGDDGQSLARPLGATQMGLIYVNPEGPGGNPDPLAAAARIRTTFGRMGMNDAETVALIGGGHTLGKAHGAHKPSECVGAEPEGAPLEQQGLGWKNKCGTGKGVDTITSGLEGAWTSTPAQWSHYYFSNLYDYEWELIEGPGGAKQWSPKGDAAKDSVPDAHDPNKKHKPMMLTTDLALKVDPKYGPISKHFYEHPETFEAAFASAWFKLTHRDMGPHVRLLGKEVPAPQAFQDPVPAVTHPLVTKADVRALKRDLLSAGPTSAQLIRAAWASASSYRDTDMRGGANGARVRLAPQKDWAVNQPAELAAVVSALEVVRGKFNTSHGRRQISLADTLVLAGTAAVEDAAKKAGHQLELPFTPGRSDATQESTDPDSFSVLEPVADGFRNYMSSGGEQSAVELLVEKADMLTLTAPEMTVLLAGMRVLNANYDGSNHGVFTERPGTLSNDYFVNLLDMGVEWQKSTTNAQLYEAKDRKTGAIKWTGTAVDLLIGSNSQLRALAEVYAADDAKKKFVEEFARAWTKVMTLDRFDLASK